MISSLKGLIALVFSFAGIYSLALSQTPVVTVRFNGPEFNCVNDQYCVDVEFLTDSVGIEVYGMNVRFFYPDNILEFSGFSDFQGGYGAVFPDPPTISSVAGGALGIIGQADFVNGAIQLLNGDTTALLIDTATWTKLFSICFDVDDPNPNLNSFCPPIVFDLEQNPANGGYLTGDEGVVITIVDTGPGDSDPTNENVVQYNWMYIGSGTPPFGQPIENDCIALIPPNADINASTSSMCYYTNRTFQPVAPLVPGASYTWTFGYGAVPATAIGYGPHTVYYDTAGTKIVKLVVDGGGPECADSSTVNFEVTSCPGVITGSVKSTTGLPVQGVNVKLYADNNLDGLADTSAHVKSVFSTSSGSYTMTGLIPGNYVIVETQPLIWLNYDDRDTSYDGDLVLNIDSLDNLIPASITPSKFDLHNLFIELAIPGSIKGAVFNDDDGDLLPDTGEGIPDAIVRLHKDDDFDGIADMGPPVSIVSTTSTGVFEFLNVPGANYVIVQIQPAGFESVKDYDFSNDLDLVLNSNINNDTIPVTVQNNENDVQNYFVKKEECLLQVTNTNDAGEGSMRYMVDCASTGDTIKFNQSLAGDTIVITSENIDINKSIFIKAGLSPHLTISSEIPGLFIIGTGFQVKFIDLDILSGLSGNQGAAFLNFGILKLHNISVMRNPLLPLGEYLIGNGSTSQLILSGSCHLMMD